MLEEQKMRRQDGEVNGNGFRHGRFESGPDRVAQGAGRPADSHFSLYFTYTLLSVFHVLERVSEVSYMTFK